MSYFDENNVALFEGTTMPVQTICAPFIIANRDIYSGCGTKFYLASGIRVPKLEKDDWTNSRASPLLAVHPDFQRKKKEELIN